MSNAGNKDLNVKGPDVVQMKAAEFLAGVAQNPKPYIGVGIALLLFVAGGYAIKLFIEHQQNKRRVALYQVETIYEDEAKALNDKREALEKKKDTLKAALPKPAGEAKDAAPVETPEIKAIDAEIKALKPDHKASSEKFKAFYEQYKDKPEGWVAGLRYAGFIAEEKRWDEAIAILDPIVKASKTLSIVQLQSAFLLVSLLQDKGEFDKALATIEVIGKSAGPQMKPSYYLSKAQTEFLKKDFAAAKASLDKLMAEHENTPEADRGRSLLALIPQ